MNKNHKLVVATHINIDEKQEFESQAEASRRIGLFFTRIHIKELSAL